jgi:hypothetical protein
MLVDATTREPERRSHSCIEDGVERKKTKEPPKERAETKKKKN